MRQLSLVGASKKVDVFQFDQASHFLRALLGCMRKARKDYSHTHFSADLGFGENTTALLMATGKRKITEVSAQKIVTALQLKGARKEYFLALVRRAAVDDIGSREETDRLVLELKARQSAAKNTDPDLRFFSAWHHSAVFEVLGLYRRPLAATEIAFLVKPSLSLEDVHASLSLLEELEIVSWDRERDTVMRTRETVDLGGEVPGLAIVGYHRQMLNLAKTALDRFSPEERDISGISIAVREADLGLLKQEIARFQDFLLSFSRQSADQERVVQVNIQLFPLSARKPGEGT